MEKAIYKLQLTNITPLHIGSGKFLNPNSELLTLEGGEVTIKNITHVKNTSPLEIQEFIQTHGQVFLPGSSIKGFFKSAYLHYWLEGKEGKRNLRIWLQDTYKKVKYYNRLPDFKKQNGKEKKKILKQISNAFNKSIEQKCFAKITKIERYNRSRIEIDLSKWHNLRLRDSNSKAQSTAIYELKRFFIQSEHEAIPTFVEAIIPQQNFDIMLQYVKDNDTTDTNKVGRQLNKLFKDKTTIAKLVNAYSLALINYELKILDYDDVENDYIRPYQDTLIQIKQDIETNPDSFYFRLGAGKLQFYQTVAMAINSIDTDDEDWDYNVWYAYLDYLSQFRESKEDELYPKTRVLTQKGKQPLGWVKAKFLD